MQALTVRPASADSFAGANIPRVKVVIASDEPS